MNRAYKILLAAMVGVVLAQAAYAQNGAASQIGNNAFDSLNRALRVDAVATGGGGNTSSSFLNLDQLFSSVYDSTHNALKVNIVSGLPCTLSSSGSITCAATGTNQSITLTPSGTGLVTVTNLADHGGQVFNVKAYGAKGNGATDDTAAINAAYAAATVVSGTVFFPCGIYKTASAIADSGPVTWQGEGQGCVVIEPAAGAAFDAFDVTSSNVSFRDLTVNANGSSSSSSGIVFTGAPLDHITLDHVTVENAGDWCASWGPHGAASAVSDLLVTNSTFRNCGGPAFGGLTTGSVSASNLQLSNDVFGSTTNPPALLTSQAHVSLYISNNGTGTFSNIVIDNNVILFPILGNGGTQQESDGLVISTGGVGGQISQVTVSGNVAYGTPGNTPEDSHTMEFWGVSDLSVQSNEIGNAYNGVTLQQGAAATSCSATFSANTFDLSLSPNVALLLNSGCDAVVTGNTVVSGSTGIQATGSNQQIVGNQVSAPTAIYMKCQISPGCTGNVVNSNVIRDSSTRSIFFAGSTYPFENAVVRGNTVSNSPYGIEFYDTSDTGIASGNTFNSVTYHYHAFPSGFVLNAFESSAPSGSCSNGSTYTNTAGASGTTFYGCEAGAWVAK